MYGPLLALVLLGGTIHAAPLSSSSASSSSKRSDPSTFYIADNESGYLANAISDSGIFFGSDRNTPTLFSIDSSTGILLTADPGQTAYDAYIDASGYSPVQISTSASSGFLKCTATDDQLTCSADGYTEFLLNEPTENSTDYQLYLVETGTTNTDARSATLSVQYSAAEPTGTPTKFYLSTSMGYAVDFGSNSGIYAGTDYAKESPGSVYTLDSSTGYLTTASSTGDDGVVGNTAYIDTATDGYSIVKLAPLPFSSSSMSPLNCQIATDGSLSLSCNANSYVNMWLDLGVSKSGDYTLYMATTETTGNGTQRVTAQAVVSDCTSCT